MTGILAHIAEREDELDIMAEANQMQMIILPGEPTRTIMLHRNQAGLAAVKLPAVEALEKKVGT